MVTPAFHLGIESFLHGEYELEEEEDMETARTFGQGPHAYVGAVMMNNFGKLWWTIGMYTRVTDISHHLQPGEPYGRLWIRSMIGYEL